MSNPLFSSCPLRGLTLDNRIIISPMCQYSARSGSATDWHLIHLGALALSGAGMMFIEATAVEPEGRITSGCLGLYSDDNEAALGRVIQALRRYADVPIGIQLAHSGRKGSSYAPWDGGQLQPVTDGGWQPVAPSPQPQLEGEAAPMELDIAGIARIREAFAASAQRAARLGFDALELHCAHGYLLHEFLSPLSNKRDDRYGGSLENRMRLPLEIFDAVRAVWPAERPMGVRVSATDWVEDGWDLEQTVVLCRRLKQLGCDWIDASSGGVSPRQKIPLAPGYQVPFSRRIRDDVGIATIAVGLITDPKHADEIIANGDADFVALARGILWDLRWPWRAAAVLGCQVRAPKQYWRAPPRGCEDVFKDVVFGAR